MTADKVGLETTLQSKNATIDDLGINLNNTQLEHQRMAMIAEHHQNLVQTVNANVLATTPMVGSPYGYGYGHPGFVGTTPGYGLPVTGLNPYGHLSTTIGASPIRGVRAPAPAPNENN